MHPVRIAIHKKVEALSYTGDLLLRPVCNEMANLLLAKTLLPIPRRLRGTANSTTTLEHCYTLVNNGSPCKTVRRGESTVQAVPRAEELSY